MASPRTSASPTLFCQTKAIAATAIARAIPCTAPNPTSRTLSRTNPKVGERISRYSLHPERLLSTVLTGNNLVNTAAAAVGTGIAATYVSEDASVAVATVGVTIILLVFAEAIPKTVATRHPLAVARLMATPLRVVEIALLPVIWLLQRLIRGVTEILGIPPVGIVTQDEIGAMIDVGRREGSVEHTQAKMLGQVLELGQRQLGDIMTYRTEIVGVPQNTTFDGFLAIYKQTPHDVYPVYQGTIDNIVGVLSRADILLHMAEGSIDASDVTKHSRQATYLPWNKSIDGMFRDADRGADLMILIDEYGGVVGIVKMAQVVAEVVGVLGTEDDATEAVPRLSGDESFTVPGSLPIEELGELIGSEIPVGHYETIAGFMISELGWLAQQGDTVEVGGYSLTAEVEGVQIETVRVAVLPEEAPSAD